MLQTQVDYWKYIESMRHNKQLEEIEKQQASAAMRTAEANYQNALTNQRKAEIDYINAMTNQANAESARIQAEASRAQAQAALTQASAAKQQANVASKNASINQYLAYSTDALNRANASNARSQSSYNSQKTQTERYNTSIAATDARFRSGTNTANIVHSYATGVGDVLGGAGRLLSGTAQVHNAWSTVRNPR